MNYSVLALSNNTGMRHVLTRMKQKFMKLYKQKVFVHHYTKYMDKDHFDTCLESCTSVIKLYEDVEKENFEADN